MERQGMDLSVGQSQVTGAFAEVMEAYQKNTTWWAVFACFDLTGFQANPQTIASYLSASEEDVMEALEGLCMLGYLKRDSGNRFVKVSGKDFLEFDYGPKSKIDSIDQHALVSQQILNEMSEERRLAFDHRCFAANDEILTELYKDVAAAYEKAFAKSRSSGRNDRIFKMTFTGVDVFKQKQGNA